MNDFRLRRIRRHSPSKPLSDKAKQNLATLLGIILAIAVVFWGGSKLLDALSGMRIFNIVTGVLGKELETDSHGHTNILLLGVGGEGHEGKDLTDTVIIASLDAQDHEVALLSIPRDLYIESTLGGSRINRLYEKGVLKWGAEEGLDFARATLEKVLDIPIPYIVKIDFEAFEKIVDAVDGIDVYVETAIDDPLYPKGNTFEYERFYLPAGNQHLDGVTALKYARSRQTTSDFDRSKRQQEVLLALKKKASEQNIFTRRHLLRKMYDSLQEHVETNLSFRELLTLAEFAAAWDSKKLSMGTLNDEPIFVGGFLYTPLRELYGGAYVLLPAGDSFDSVQFFVKLIFYGPKNIRDFPIAILNGTGEGGLAGRTKNILHRFGLKFAGVTNAHASDLAETTWYVRMQEAEFLTAFLQELIPGATVREIPAEYLINPKTADAQIILELGKDSVPMIEKLDIFRNVVELVPKGTTTSENLKNATNAKNTQIISNDRISNN